jgi:Fimbrial assembly protein (PilN)
MITINLRPGQKRKTAGSPFGGLKEKAAALGQRVKDPLLVGAVACWVLVLGGLGLVYVRNARAMADLQPRLEQAQAEHRRFQTFLQQKRHQELIRDSLVRQIATIRTVDGDRYVWPHILDEVAKALPAYTWLVGVTVGTNAAPAGTTAPTPAPAPKTKADSAAADSVAGPPPPVQFLITGRTVDIQAYTRFLRQLEASPWITAVTPVSAQTVVEQERPVTAFTIRAQFERADSAYIRTVPFSQSVR